MHPDWPITSTIDLQCGMVINELAIIAKNDHGIDSFEYYYFLRALKVLSLFNAKTVIIQTIIRRDHRALSEESPLRFKPPHVAEELVIEKFRQTSDDNDDVFKVLIEMYQYVKRIEHRLL